jgi:hypothetical protein
MNILVGLAILVLLILAGVILSVIISAMTCKKTSISGSIPEGISWALPIFVVYFLLNGDFGGYPSSVVLPIFSQPMQSVSNNPDLIGKIYAMLLITCVVTTRMFHTTDVAICIPSKDESKAFEEALAKELKEKQAAKETSSSK